jgi:hypothetical protein
VAGFCERGNELSCSTATASQEKACGTGVVDWLIGWLVDTSFLID